jgi:hypothetical protein
MKGTGTEMEYGERHPVTNQETLNKLNKGSMSGEGSKKNMLYSLPSKPDYYYRKTNAGDYVKFKGDLNKHSYASKPITTIKKGDPNFDYLDKNRKYAGDVRGENMVPSNQTKKVANKNTLGDAAWNAAKAVAATGLYGRPLPTPRKMSNEHLWDSLHSVFAPMLGFQEGGFTDPDSGLYKFMGGGEDMNQANLNYSNSKNISSPYFAEGGLYRFDGEKDSEVTKDNTVLTEDEKAAKAATDKAAADKAIADKTAADKLATETARNAYIDEQIKKGKETAGADTDYENFDYAKQYLENHGMNSPYSFISRGNNWNKAVGSPYGTGTLNPISGMIGPNAQVSSINVNKSRLNGTPKKFTVNYNVPGQNGVVNPIASNVSNATNSQSGERTRGVIGTADRPESRASSMYRRLFEKDMSPTEKNTIYDNNGMPTNDYAPGVIENLRNPGSTIPLQYINAILGNGANGAKSSLRSADDVNMTGTGSYSETGYSPRVIAPYSGPMTQGTPPDQSYFESGNTGSVGFDPEKGFYAYGGNALPKAQFGPANQAFGPEEEKDNRDYIPPGYYFNAVKGQIENSAGVKYDPTSKVNSFFSADIDKSGVPDYLQKSDDQQVSQKFKNKQEWNIDAQGALDFGNMAGNKLAGFMDRAQQAKQNRNMGSKYDASNLYAQTDETDRGTYGQEGDFRPDETGFKGVVKYGGYMKEGGNHDKNGYTWMSQEQIEQFLAEGGELEFV